MRGQTVEIYSGFWPEMMHHHGFYLDFNGRDGLFSPNRVLRSSLILQ